ncbi:hypothetical protein COT65_00145 [Candidatus Shapirobacteria bacterium CG09_land_8_20_14_0_10_47_13]|uniref:Peptidase C51 domain-containing protein n=1 Tax=Candidatus Shapirobacteria bacterium CG09_land_8_20_14_0_10_47_13 TaxID=1974481 RepID=A0A2H0WNG8_9BACT|nr:MAG: hypothetical protein COT65_00145 [Candidatus Shapirobacteria bacterium CG09_land_8_20_14_0_10_47_13]
MNISLTIKKTIKRFIGKVVSRFTKPKKPLAPEPEIPSPPVTIPQFEAPGIPPTPQAVSQPEPPQFQSPSPQSSPSLLSPQNPIISFFTRLGKRIIGRVAEPGAEKIAIGKLISRLTKPKKVIVPPLETPKIAPAPQAVSQPESSRPQPLPSQPQPENPVVSMVTSLGKMAIRKTIEAGTKKIAVGKFLGGMAGRVASFLPKAAGTMGGFLSGLTAVSLPAALPLVAVIGAIVVVVLVTVITIMAVGGAFQKGHGGQISNLGNPIVARAPSPTSQLGETAIWTLNQCGIAAVNKGTWARTEVCLRSSSLPNKETIISQFHFSVFEVGPGLQCVGFVRGVMAALGKDPGGGRDAKGYLNPPPPVGYQPINTNMQNVQVGDLVIMRGSNDGHIAIVIEKNADSIRVAQAWGTNGGAIQITEINPVYFDGFLRPQ